MKRLALLILFVSVQTLVAQTSRDAATGAIEGIVVSALSGQPIEEAQLRLYPTNQNGFRDYEAPAIPFFFTDSDGKFAFAGLKPGRYGMEIGSNGFVRQEYGQMTFPGEGKTIEVPPNEAVKGLAIRLTPTGTINGRVRDMETRQPVAGVLVQWMRRTYSYEGESVLEPAGMARTNDRGEYRLYFVTPGRYYLQAGGVVPRRAGASVTAYSNEIPSTYATVYYPAATRTEDATIVDVKPGADIGGMDVFVGKREDLYRVRGRVLDSATGQPPASANVRLYRRVGTRWETATDVFNYRAADGSFEYRNLPSGAYVVSVEGGRFWGYATSVVATEIAGADVDGIVVPRTRGAAITGRVSFEGQKPPEKELGELRIALFSPDRLLSSGAQVTTTGTSLEGTLRFDHVTAGEYRARVYELPEGFYVKEARLGGVDVLDGTAKITDRDLNDFRVVISANAAVIEGVVRNDRLDVVVGGSVVLVPDRNRDRTDLFQRVLSDREGRFSFPSVPPGSYKVFAWEALEPHAEYDPDVLRLFEQRGRAVQVVKSSKPTVNITAIPANN
jgi:protocatechuate 3,4-dioxygenase beta subunit